MAVFTTLSVLGALAVASSIASGWLFCRRRTHARRIMVELMQTAARDKEESAPIRLAVQREEEAKMCSFWFVDAELIRTSTLTTLPVFQELAKQDGALRKLPITRYSAYHGDYVGEYCAVSHRWLNADMPDTEGTQIRAVQTFLREHPEIKGCGTTTGACHRANAPQRNRLNSNGCCKM